MPRTINELALNLRSAAEVRQCRMMDIEDWVRRHGRIAHSSDLIRAGATTYGIRTAIASGPLMRVRRDWIALPDCDPELLLAARSGARLTCLTAAQRLGLWVAGDAATHLSLPAHASRHNIPTDAVAHWAVGPVAVSGPWLTEPLENVLVQVAECQPFESAVVVLDSALRLKKITAGHLERIATRSRRFRAARAAATAFSDSGIETIPRLRLARIGIALRQQVVIDEHPVDGIIGDRLILQIDGYGPHSSAEQRRRDLRQDARLTLMGYTVLRFDYAQIVGNWAYVESTILAAMAQGLHLAG